MCRLTSERTSAGVRWTGAEAVLFLDRQLSGRIDVWICGVGVAVSSSSDALLPLSLSGLRHLSVVETGPRVTRPRVFAHGLVGLVMRFVGSGFRMRWV